MDYLDDINDLFDDENEEAQEMLDDPDRVEELLHKLENKLKKLRKLSGVLAYVPRMGMLVNSWLKREYTGLPIGTLVAVIGAILYFVAPADLIADILPGIGYLDDAALISTVLMLVKSDLDEYTDWRIQEGLDVPDA